MKVLLSLVLVLLTSTRVQGAFYDYGPPYDQGMRDREAGETIAAETAEEAVGRAFEKALGLAARQQQAGRDYGMEEQGRREEGPAVRVADGAQVHYYEAR